MGMPLSRLEGGYYDVHGTNVQVNSARVDECSEAIDELVGFID
jgi:hypothetical protein